MDAMNLSEKIKVKISHEINEHENKDSIHVKFHMKLMKEIYMYGEINLQAW